MCCVQKTIGYSLWDMDSFPRYRKKQKEEDENEGLLVFGYTCRIYPDSERANLIAEEKHLQNWNGDPEIRIDRYDARLLLSSFNESVSSDTEVCPTEEMEEQMCDEERYLDMYCDLKTKAEKEEEEKKRRAEINFDYGTSVVNGTATVDDSDSEDEPFVSPPGIKLPVGLTLPENQKQNHLIEKTAVFVVAQGPQMEIVIKAKQRNNTEQFGFLDFENSLYPYYKYISKLIREKKYTPEITKNKGSGQDRPTTPEQKVKPFGALAAIAIDHGSDDSDSDCELHPSLLSRNREPSPDVMDKTSIGPMRKPASPPPQPVSVIRSDYDMSKSTDSYASLFKSLSNIKAGKDEEKIKEEKRNQELKGLIIATSGFPPDEEWRSWWATFYGFACPMKAPCPLIPPPPDLEPVVNNYACFVARHGAATELALRARADLQLNFMNPNNPHFSYYQHKVRLAQWEMNQMAGLISNRPVPVYTYSTAAPETAGVSEPSSPGPEASLNRKQRRRLQDSSVIGVTPPPGVIDPILFRNNMEINKSQSSPSLQTNSAESDSSDISAQPYTPTGSISFSIQPIKEEPKKTSIDLDDPLEAMVQDDFQPSTSAGPSLPTTPVILNNTQLDRKEKARIFMEKLMNEKRAKKLQEAENARIQELEKKKLELEQELQKEESTEEIKVYEATSDNDDEQRKTTTQEPVRPSLHMIDELINKRIDNLLESNGLSYITSTSKIPSDSENDRKKKDKKEKKKKSKHRYERRRSRSRSKERSKESKRRRRSSSSDRDSRRRVR